MDLRHGLLLLLFTVSSGLCATNSSKRGLVYVSSSDSTVDDRLWTDPISNLRWYYNYKSRPSPNLVSSPLEFVPMLWGASATDDTDTSFLDDIRSQLQDGAKINHVLGFNEPDGEQSTGGSNIPAELAASTWIRQIEPLRRENEEDGSSSIKLGAPAVTGSQRGLLWLESFFRACDGGCTVDFIPIHFYGDFEGLASHMGQVRAAYPNLTVWVTEYALANGNLKESQTFFNTSLEYFDRLE